MATGEVDAFGLVAVGEVDGVELVVFADVGLELVVCAGGVVVEAEGVRDVC